MRFNAIRYFGYENVATRGEQIKSVDPHGSLALLSYMMSSEFQEYDEYYISGELCEPYFSDQAEADIWFSVGTLHKRVRFSWGCSSTEIPRLDELATRIDEATGSLEWTGVYDPFDTGR